MEFANWLNGNIQKIKQPLYKNSIYLIINMALMALFGYFFWAVAGRLYSTEYVGYGTALMSVASLISMIAMLGFGITLIRFVPEERDKKRLFSSCAIVSFAVAFIAGLVFLLFVGYLSPQLQFVRDSTKYAIIFLIIISSYPVFGLVDSFLLALRKVKVILIKNGAWCIIKIGLLFLVAGLGAFAVFGAFGLAVALVAVLSLILLAPKLVMDFGFLKDSIGFSAGNYVGGLFYTLPAYVLPVFILNRISPAHSAYFYISLAIAGLLFIIPNAVSSNLLVESSYTKENKIRGAVKFSVLLVLAGIFAMLLLGSFLLGLVGPEYKENSLLVLYILTFSSFPAIFNQIYVAVCNVEKKIRNVVLINFLISAITLGLAYAFIGYGLIAVALAWLAGQSAVAIISFAGLWKKIF